MKKIKQFLIKFSFKLFIPVVILSCISFLFEQELANFPFIKIIRLCLFITIVIVVIGGLIELFKRK